MTDKRQDPEDKVVPLASRRRPGPRCPICGKPATRESRPFCSSRCAHVDLGRWLDGSYRIPTEEAPQETGPPPADEE